jgi:hypothetical protein
MENMYRLERVDSPLNHNFCPKDFSSFINLIHLKKNGYSSYPDNFLAFKGIDLYSISYLLYLREEERPFATLRNININFFHDIGLKVPISELICNSKGFDSLRVKKAYKELIIKAQAQKKPLIYSSNFTIRTTHRNREKPYSKDAKNIMAAATAYDFKRLEASGVICGAIKKYKTEPLFNSWGYEGLRDEAGEIDYFEKEGTGGEEVKIMLMKRPSELSDQYLNEWHELFNFENLSQTA